MKVISANGIILGKTKTDFGLDDTFTIVAFDPANADHKKAKFLTTAPVVKDLAKTIRSPNSAWQWLIDFGHWQSIEGCKKASNSELKRWLENKAVIVNGEPLIWDEEMDFHIFSVVLFPNSELRRCTLF